MKTDNKFYFHLYHFSMLGNAPMFTISIFKITNTLTDEVRLELFIFLFFFFGLNILFPGREISCIFNNA